MLIEVTEADLRRAINALRYQAQNEAGQSQAPDLYSKEETIEWASAKRLEAGVNAVLASRRKNNASGQGGEDVANIRTALMAARESAK